MKTLTIPILCSAVALLLPSSSKAEFYQREVTADYLFRQQFTLGPGQTVTAQTTGCDPGEDTVLVLLEGDLYASGAKTTRAFNDDRNPGGGDYCSLLSFTNQTTTTRTYSLIGSTYTAGTTANVGVQVTSPSFNINNPSVTFGGATVRFTGTGRGESYQVLPVRSQLGGHPMDSVIYVIDPLSGGVSQFDDDSGPQALSWASGVFTCATCWVIAANYWADGGGPIRIWGQKWANASGGGVDSDGDGVNDTIESMIGESSTNDYDSDDDGILDSAELDGAWGWGGQSIAGVSDNAVVVAWSGAIANQPDLFLEVDYMADSTHSHQPYNLLGTNMVQVLQNDSAWTGRTVNTHIEVSGAVPESAAISFLNCGNASIAGRTNFYNLKTNWSYFNQNRTMIYHYAIFAHQRFNNDSTCSLSNSSGVAELLGNDVIVSLGAAPAINSQLGTTIHELGHNLDLTHNGNDDSFGLNLYGCIHSSVMNYRWQFNGWGNSGLSIRGFGYSRGGCPSGGSGIAQGGAGNCATTPNTCVGRCVPAGQVTLKGKCPLATSGPNAGQRVSDGVCDCDLDEWASPPPNSSQVGRVSLNFLDNGQYIDGRTTEDEAFIAGAAASVPDRHRQVVAGRRGRFEREGLVAGKDFVVGDNGKTYVAE